MNPAGVQDYVECNGSGGGNDNGGGGDGAPETQQPSSTEPPSFSETQSSSTGFDFDDDFDDDFGDERSYRARKSSSPTVFSGIRWEFLVLIALSVFF